MNWLGFPRQVRSRPDVMRLVKLMTQGPEVTVWFNLTHVIQMDAVSQVLLCSVHLFDYSWFCLN